MTNALPPAGTGDRVVDVDQLRLAAAAVLPDLVRGVEPLIR